MSIDRLVVILSLTFAAGLVGLALVHNFLALNLVLMTAGVGLFGSFTGLIASWILSPTKKDRQQDSVLAKLQEQIGAIQRQLAPEPMADQPGGPPELARLVAAWSTLPPHVKDRILDDVEGHRSKAA